MFEYASMHNTCKLDVMLDSNVMKTHFRRKKLYMPYTCHELPLCTCHRLVNPVMHQLYFKFESIFPYRQALGKFRMLGSYRMPHPKDIMALHGFTESEFDKLEITVQTVIGLSNNRYSRYM
jgi:hypothetical protein